MKEKLIFLIAAIIVFLLMVGCSVAERTVYYPRGIAMGDSYMINGKYFTEICFPSGYGNLCNIYTTTYYLKKGDLVDIKQVK